LNDRSSQEKNGEQQEHERVSPKIEVDFKKREIVDNFFGLFSELHEHPPPD
jgi:hypothetical protein